jgi:hypothetical protein
MSYSGKAVHRASATGGQEAFFEGHVRAFEVLGGVPAAKIRYDNLKAAVAQVIGFSRQRGSCCNSATFSVGDVQRTPVEVALDDRQQLGFHGDAAFFAAFASDEDDGGAVVGDANITDFGLTEFLGAQPRQQCGENDRQIAFGLVGSALGSSRGAQRPIRGNQRLNGPRADGC